MWYYWIYFDSRFKDFVNGLGKGVKEKGELWMILRFGLRKQKDGVVINRDERILDGVGFGVGGLVDWFWIYLEIYWEVVFREQWNK